MMGEDYDTGWNAAVEAITAILLAKLEEAERIDHEQRLEEDEGYIDYVDNTWRGAVKAVAMVRKQPPTEHHLGEYVEASAYIKANTELFEACLQKSRKIRELEKAISA